MNQEELMEWFKERCKVGDNWVKTIKWLMFCPGCARKGKMHYKFICENCRTDKNLVRHHKKTRKAHEHYSEWRIQDIRILCKGCHFKLHINAHDLCPDCGKKTIKTYGDDTHEISNKPE